MEISFRNICGWLLARLLISFGLVRRARKRAMEGEFILSIYFHKPTKKEFESCIKWLTKNRFNILTVSKIDNIIHYNLPFPKGAALITVDDGWHSNECNIVEVANQHKVPVTIFVSTTPVEEGVYWWSYIIEAKKRNIKCLTVDTLKMLPESERLLEVNRIKHTLCLEREAMTVEQIRRVADSKYVTIGGHTATHPILVNCEDEQIYAELKSSKDKLESWLGKNVGYFAYPNGDYSPREVQVLQELNYNLAFCSDQVLLTPDRLKNHYMLPRFGFLEGASTAENICRIVGVWKPLLRKIKNPLSRTEKRKAPPAVSNTINTRVLPMTPLLQQE